MSELMTTSYWITFCVFQTFVIGLGFILYKISTRKLDNISSELDKEVAKELSVRRKYSKICRNIKDNDIDESGMLVGNTDRSNIYVKIPKEGSKSRDVLVEKMCSKLDSEYRVGQYEGIRRLIGDSHIKERAERALALVESCYE